MSSEEVGEVDPPAPPVRWGMGDALLGNLLSIVLSTVAVAIALGVTGDEDLDDIPLWGSAVLQVPLWGGLLAAVLWSTYGKGRRSLRADFSLAMRPGDIGVGLVAGLFGQLAITLVTIPVYQLLGIDLDRVGEVAEEITERATTGADVVFLVLIVVIGAPLVEELFYRGLWFRSLERRWGTTAAVVTSSVLFGAAHLQPYDLLPLSLAGLLFVLLLVRSGRLGPAIWAHVAFNLTAVVNLVWLS